MIRRKSLGLLLVLGSALGCDPAVRGIQAVRVVVQDVETGAPMAGSRVSCVSQEHMTWHSIPQQAALDRFGTPPVDTDINGEALILVPVAQIGSKLTDQVTGSLYLFRILDSAEEAEILPVHMQPGNREEGRYYRVTVASIGYPIQTYRSSDSTFDRDDPEKANPTSSKEAP